MQKSARLIRVVLADDVPEIMDEVAKRLSPDFIVVAKCGDGAALVESVLEFEPDLVVTDISMPKLNGIEALRLLRHRGFQTPAIILTAHQDEDFVKEARAVGIQGFVLKRRLITDFPLAVHTVLNGGIFISNESASVQKADQGVGTVIVNDDGARAQASSEILLNRDGLFIAKTDGMQWQSTDTAGCEKKILFADEREKSVTSIVRMQAGTHFPPHCHGGVEEVFMLEGDLVVEGQRMKPGDYCRAERTTVHRESFTESGCVFLLKASQYDRILDDESR